MAYAKPCTKKKEHLRQRGKEKNQRQSRHEGEADYNPINQENPLGTNKNQNLKKQPQKFHIHISFQLEGKTQL